MLGSLRHTAFRAQLSGRRRYGFKVHKSAAEAKAEARACCLYVCCFHVVIFLVVPGRIQRNNKRLRQIKAKPVPKAIDFLDRPSAERSSTYESR